MNKKKQTNIGLIVPSEFRFSETFFIDDCRTWKKMGFCVTIFPLQNVKTRDKVNLKNFASSPPYLSKNNFIKALQLFKIFPRLAINRSIGNVLRFFTLERQKNASIKAILSRVYTNVHVLLRQDLDYLVLDRKSVV